MYTKLIKKTLKLASVSLLGLGLMTSAVAADNYPNKAINVVVGFGIGGSADRMSRSMSTFFQMKLNKE